MSQKVVRTKPTLPNIFFLNWIVGLLAIVVLLVIQLISGGFKASQFEFLEFQVRHENSGTKMIDEYSPPIQSIYVCGNIEADGVVQGAIDVYLEDDLIISQSFSHPTGDFAEEITYRNGFQPGKYTVNFFTAKRIHAQTMFTVTVDTSTQ